MMMAKDGEVALLFQPLLGLAANFSGVSREPSGRSDDRGLIEGVLEAPSGASPRIRTVWILETGETNPRFVTAYPA